MSVVEFFMNYWDWYLLIGVIIGLAGLLYDPDRYSFGDKVGVIITSAIFWPVVTLSAIVK